MNRTLQYLQTYFFAVAIAGPLMLSACGGGDDADYTAPTPQCHGAATITCAELDAEFCVQVGCELRLESEGSGPRCTGETAPSCTAVSYEGACERVRGCKWV
jgi:hypothetical protein